MTKRFLFSLILLAALGRPSAAQVLDTQLVQANSSGGACTAVANSCASFTLAAVTSVTLQVSGTWTGTLTFEATTDGTNWNTVGMKNLATGVDVTTTTANGSFATANVGLVGVRARATAAITGSASVAAARGYASVRSLPFSSAVPVPVASGGTGLSSYAIGDLLTASASTTLAKLADVAVGSVLVSGGVGVVPAWSATPTLTSVAVGDGTAALPSVTFASQAAQGLYHVGTNQIGIATGTAAASGGVYMFSANSGLVMGGNTLLNWTTGNDPTGSSIDVSVARDAANTIAVRNGSNAQTVRIGPSPGYVNIASANIATAPTDSTVVESGGVTRFRSSSTITPASAGVGNCAAAFKAAALTADCTIATLPAGMKLVGIYADVTAGFTCSGTCTGTKVMRAGISAGGVEILATSLNVAATGTFGLADADLGSGMTRAAAIQGGYMPSWSATTPVIVRFTSGTGNWGNGSATFVNAGSVKFTLITEQVK